MIRALVVEIIPGINPSMMYCDNLDNPRGSNERSSIFFFLVQAGRIDVEDSPLHYFINSILYHIFSILLYVVTQLQIFHMKAQSRYLRQDNRFHEEGLAHSRHLEQSWRHVARELLDHGVAILGNCQFFFVKLNDGSIGRGDI